MNEDALSRFSRQGISGAIFHFFCATARVRPPASLEVPTRGNRKFVSRLKAIGASRQPA
jgi:hypothetical protein